MNSDRAARWIQRHRALFPLLPDPPELLDRWQSLIHQFQITGFQVHDARYVAAMQCLQIPTLLTYNLKHFRHFPIRILDPDTV
jgi:hypothetical protein